MSVRAAPRRRRIRACVAVPAVRAREGAPLLRPRLPLQRRVRARSRVRVRARRGHRVAAALRRAAAARVWRADAYARTYTGTHRHTQAHTCTHRHTHAHTHTQAHTSPPPTHTHTLPPAHARGTRCEREIFRKRITNQIFRARFLGFWVRVETGSHFFCSSIETRVARPSEGVALLQTQFEHGFALPWVHSIETRGFALPWVDACICSAPWAGAAGGRVRRPRSGSF